MNGVEHVLVHQISNKDNIIQTRHDLPTGRARENYSSINLLKNGMGQEETHKFIHENEEPGNPT